MTREEMLRAGPLPPFIRELRDKVRAGRKTETRRVIDPAPPEWALFCHYSEDRWGVNRQHFWNFTDNGAFNSWTTNCRLGRDGQLKYLREPLKNVNGWAFYADDDVPVGTERGAMPWKWQVNKLSQRFMPRVAARTFARVSAVRPERLWDISETSVIAEGITRVRLGKRRSVFYDAPLPPGFDMSPYCDAKSAFEGLWDFINGERDGGKFAWKKNPWVWVIKFRLEVINGKTK